MFFDATVMLFWVVTYRPNIKQASFFLVSVCATSKWRARRPIEKRKIVAILYVYNCNVRVGRGFVPASSVAVTPDTGI